MQTIFHNIQQFSAEWNAARETLNAREQEALDAITTKPARNAVLAEKHGVTSGRIQQINGVAMRKVRRWAYANDTPELLYTAQAIGRIAQQAGLHNVHHFRQMRHKAFQQLIEQLLRLEVINEEQNPHLRQACALNEAGNRWQRSLEGAARDIRKMLEQRRHPMSTDEIRDLLPQRKQELDHWPQLDMGLFTTAWLGTKTDENGNIFLRENRRLITDQEAPQ